MAAVHADAEQRGGLLVAVACCERMLGPCCSGLHGRLPAYGLAAAGASTRAGRIGQIARPARQSNRRRLDLTIGHQLSRRRDNLHAGVKIWWTATKLQSPVPPLPAANGSP